MRAVVFLSIISMLLAALPAAAQSTSASAWPGANGSYSQTRRSTDNGPQNPGVGWITALSDIDAGTNADGERNVILGLNGVNNNLGYPIIDDGQGHIVAHVEIDDGGNEDEALIALNQSDGSVAWLTDPLTLEVEPSCSPMVDSTGGLWALASRSEDTRVPRPSVLPVRIDPADGSVLERPLDDDMSDQLVEDTLGGFCNFVPTITPDDLMIFQFRGPHPLMGIDLTEGSVAFRVDWQAAGYRPVSWAVPTPDGERILVGADLTRWAPSHTDSGGRPPTVVAIDAHDGTILDSRVLNGGEEFYDDVQKNPAVGLPDGDVVFGVTNRGLNSGRLLRLTPDLGVVWDVPTVRNAPEGQLDEVGALSLGGADGELVIGWSTSTRPKVFAVSVADGSLVWSADPESIPGGGEFSITVDASGTAYLATFGLNDEARLQVLSPDGTLGATLTGDVLPNALRNSGVRSMGPVVDGQLFVALNTREDPVFMAVDNSGEGAVPGDGEPTTSTAEVEIPAGVSRPAGTSDDPRQIAVDLCQFLNAADGSARAVILAQDEIFADALTGSPLAGDDGCVLFTGRAPESLDPATAAEIDRALPDGGTVYLLGGTSALAPSVESTLNASGYDVQRLSGPGRIQTATAIAQEVQLLNSFNTTAMLAFEGNWPDAVAGGAYGAEAGIPILLTGTDSLPDDTLAYLTASEIDEVILLGSNAVISDAIEEGFFQEIIRAGGVNRMATAVEITSALWQTRSSVTEDRFLMVNLEAPNAWTLALAAAPLSARVNAPQLGIGNTRYPTETREFLQTQGFAELPAIGLIGGVAFIGDDIESEIANSLEP